MTSHEHLDRIDHLASLEDGWNDGCPAISRKSLEVARAFVYNLNLYDGYFFPGVNGDICLEWFHHRNSLTIDISDGDLYVHNWDRLTDESGDMNLRHDDYVKLQEIIDNFVGENEK